MSSITDRLLKAYQGTSYHVYADPPFTLQPGVYCTELEKIHNRHMATKSAVITAWNPYSNILPMKINEQRHERLIEKVSDLGLHSYASVGQHPSGGWPAEQSLFVVDIKFEDVADLGQFFEQNAVVFATTTAIPRIAILV